MEVNATRGRAIIIGASLAGLFAATLLRKAGWHTEVFERSDVELVGRGAGITTHPELLQSLVRSGADLNDLGVVVHERIALDAGGRVVERLPPYEQIVTSASPLYRNSVGCRCRTGGDAVGPSAFKYEEIPRPAGSPLGNSVACN